MPLKKIDLDATDSQYTVLLHGDTGSGKTSLAATFEKVLFLSASDEAGWETLRSMKKNPLLAAKFHNGIVPEVWEITKPNDLIEAHQDVQPLIKQGKIKSIAVDSLTFIVEMMFEHIVKTSGAKDPRQNYGILMDQLRTIRIKYHQLPCNMIWLATTRISEELGKLNVPDIKGKSAYTFAAGCKYVWYMKNDNNKFSLRTKKFANNLARGRDGGKLPDPILDPTFTKIDELLSRVDGLSNISEEEALEEIMAEETQSDSNMSDQDGSFTFTEDKQITSKVVAPVKKVVQPIKVQPKLVQPIKYQAPVAKKIVTPSK